MLHSSEQCLCHVHCATVQEVIGGAVAIYGMSGGAIPMWGGVLITCAVAYALLSIAEYVQRDFLQWFMMSVLAVLIIAFIILFARSTQEANELFKGIFVPSLDGSTQVGLCSKPATPC